METLHIGASTREAPFTWNELRCWQLLDILPILYTETQPDRWQRGFPNGSQL